MSHGLRPVEPPVAGATLEEALLRHAVRSSPAHPDDVVVLSRVERADGVLVQFRACELDPRGRLDIHEARALARPTGEGWVVVACSGWTFVSGNVV